ncbi:MAG: hypothetical protein JWL63_1323 [Rhodocyclales bacterium]|nr:hypothetical protein [Rhodocyclales bacterium]
MSLLIDALKQAEAARAQAKGESLESPEDGLELEPLPTHRGTATQATTATNARSEASAPLPSREPRRSRPAGQRPNVVASDAARELFEVKQPAPNRLPLILAAVGVLLFLCGAGYVWWAMQPHSSLVGPALNAGANTNIPVSNAADSQALASIPSPAPNTPPGALPQELQTSSGSAVASAEEAAQRRSRREMFRAPASTTKRAAETSQTDTLSTDSARLQIRSGNSNTSDANGIQAAYTAFLEGNYSVARQRYQEVLRQDPRSVDAMNALGLIAWRSGQPDVAERMFRAALHADPKDATAMAQLALLYSEGDSTASESRLRNLIASQPAAAPAYFALGSLLSRQERWSEAQQALFQAYTLDSDNPDVLFNLAVCLEHLSQPTVARQFYDRALQAAARRPAGFDKSLAQGRLLALGSR